MITLAALLEIFMFKDCSSTELLLNKYKINNEGDYIMDNDLNAADQFIKAEIDERNNALFNQRRYYDSLHYVDLYPINASEYYEGLKDRSRFKEPKDKSHKDAEKDLGISRFLKLMALFFESSKFELNKKRVSAVELEKEYSESFAKRVSRRREQFYQRQDKGNKAVDLMLQNLMQHDPAEVQKYFQTVLASDQFTLDMLETNELYQSFVAVTNYDAKSSELSYNFRIPSQEEICSIDRFFYDDEKRIITARDLDKTRTRNIKLRMVRAMILRSATLVYYSDAYGNIKTVNVTGYLNYNDSAIGDKQSIDVIRVKIDKDTFEKLKIERLKLDDLFVRVLDVKEAAGIYSKEPYELKKIK